MAKSKEEIKHLEITATDLIILQIAVEHHLVELEKVLKKAKYLGVEVSKATQVDIEKIETLRKKLDGQEPLKM